MALNVVLYVTEGYNRRSEISSRSRADNCWWVCWLEANFEGIWDEDATIVAQQHKTRRRSGTTAEYGKLL